jgi:glycine betaine catabolism B
MEHHILKIQSIVSVTHNVHRLRLDKPEGYRFTPGQATEVSINKAGWQNEKRPFTFTCLNSDPYLEFTIKSYPHNGVTQQIGELKAGDELILRDVWGAIEYKGKGYFIAGGAGITPFIAILRQLHRDGKAKGNKLFFSNKTGRDIIYKDELKTILGEDAVFVITDEKNSPYINAFIDEKFLVTHIQDFTKQFYICGPDPMIKAISEILEKKGAQPDAVIFEK